MTSTTKATRETTAPQALTQASITLRRSSARLTKLTADRLARVERLSSELMALLEEGGAK